MISGGNCTGEDTEKFYDPYRWSEAKAVCDGCPLETLLACREAFATDPFAFAGGMRPAHRLNWAQNRTDTKRRLEALRGPVEGPAEVPQSTPGRRVNQEQRDQIIAIFDSGLIGTKEIARRVGVSKTTVVRILRAADRNRTPEENAELSRQGALKGGRPTSAESGVAQLYAEGATTEDIMEQVGISRSHVYAIRRRLGIAPDNRENARKVYDLLDQGKEVKAIAREIGLSESRVYQIRQERKAA